MRKDVVKLLFFGLERDREPLFEKMQQLGLVHFIAPDKMKPVDVPAVLSSIEQAIKVLLGLPVMEQEGADFADAQLHADEILSLKQSLELIEEQMRVASVEMARVEPFGRFNPEDIAYIEERSGRTWQFFCAKKKIFDKTNLPEGFFFVHSDSGLDYFVALRDQPAAIPKMIEMKVDVPMIAWKAKLAALKEEWRKKEDTLKGYAKYLDYLHRALALYQNQYNLVVAKHKALGEVQGKMFAVRGWVPSSHVQQVKDACLSLSVVGEEIAIDEKDVIPTYLENEGVAKMGEDLVGIYDTPSARDKDPSIWVLGAFSLFFALIIGDGGYGLIYLAICLFLWWKVHPQKGLPRRVLLLFTWLSSCCILWGVLSASFFGISLSLDSPFRKFSLVQWLAEKKTGYMLAEKGDDFIHWAKKFPALREVGSVHEAFSSVPDLLAKTTDEVVFEIALLIGLVHIGLSMTRYLFRTYAFTGWLLVLIGAYLYVPTYLDATSMLNYLAGISKHWAAEQGCIFMMAGLGLAVCLSVLQNHWKGIFEPLTLIQVASDVLSYLRIYALGLAGGIMAATINEMAAEMPLVFALIVSFLAHGLNMALSVMSGVIHGLRLNFLEWFHYSFEGGGKPFQPLKLLELE